MSDPFPSLTTDDFPGLTRLTPQDVIITASIPLRGGPRDIESGTLRWHGGSFEFEFNHEFSDGTVYAVFGRDGKPVAWIADNFELDEANTPEEGVWVRDGGAS